MEHYAEHYEVIERVEFRIPWENVSAFWEWARGRGYEGTESGHMDDDGNMLYTVERRRRDIERKDAEQLELFA